ncbi:MAG: asparaginase domain-containing protein [Pseudomonadota bacterium]
MTLKFITTGGTIDKIYFDANSRFEVGESQLSYILAEALVTFEYEIVSLMRKDSLEMTDADRSKLRDFIAADRAERFVVTHGTDTMAASAEALVGIPGKTIVLTGALSPARFRTTDATFNVGMAVAAAQTLDAGVYLAVSGRVFDAGRVRKNLEAQRFEEIIGE